MPSLSSPADLAGKLELRRRRPVGGCGNRASDFQAWCSSRRHLQAGQMVLPANSGGLKASFLASTAQAIRANLLASATIAMFWCVRAVSCASHALNPDDCLVR